MFPFSQTLIFSKLPELHVYIPFQVLAERQRNLTSAEMRLVFLLLRQSKSIQWDYTLPSKEAVTKWKEQGAKKGDAFIAASLERVSIHYLIWENRHFLNEISNLPFQVLSSEAIIHALGNSSDTKSE